MKKEKIEELIHINERKINFLKAKITYLERNKKENKKEIGKVNAAISNCEWSIKNLKKMLKE